MKPKEAFNHIKNEKSTKLWQYMTDMAIDHLDFEVAEKCMLKQQNYSGLQMIKRVQLIEDPSIQKAEVLAYFKRITEADNILKTLERKDLQLKFKMRLGQWVTIQHMIKEGAGYDDILNQAYNQLGNYHADRK